MFYRTLEWPLPQVVKNGAEAIAQTSGAGGAGSAIDGERAFEVPRTQGCFRSTDGTLKLEKRRRKFRQFSAADA
jgi:hypothetical protein